MKICETFNLDSKKVNRKIYFCSDLHYNHANVIKFGSRPFDNVEDMNASIIEELQGKLRKNDILFTLGDDFWCTKENKIIEILDSLPTKNLYKVMGNHDKYGYYYGQGKVKDKYKVVGDIIDISVMYKGKQYSLSLCHYPISDFNRMYHGGLHLFGHVHGNFDANCKNDPRLRVDVGYDGELAKRVGSFLISFEDILDYFLEKTGGMDFDQWGREHYKSTVDGYNQ